MRCHFTLPILSALAGSVWLFGATLHGQPRSPIDPSFGVVVARLGARPFLHEGRVRSITFLDDSRRVASVDDKSVAFWSVPDGTPLRRPAQLSASDPIRISSAAANGRIIAVAAGAEISVLDSQKAAGEFRRLGRESAVVTALAVS